ncbi:MAG: aminopeptidase P family protein [Alphaproteobacteria bacterium]|nr:aminopeptidase P family protein [Alphaproteobacteria bacterium]
MLLNRTRATAIMAKYELEGLVAREHINIHYLTDYWDTQADGRWPYLVYGVLPRRDDAPAGLVLPTVKLERLTPWPTWVPNLVAFSDYSGRERVERGAFDPRHEEPKAARWGGWPTRAGAELSPLEQHWTALARRHADHLAATPAWGLRRALKDAGLTRGRIGSDDPRVLHWMREMGLPDIVPVDSTNVFREIRMVKSEAEIAVMAEAARINEAACYAAAAVARDGTTWEEIETTYHLEMSRRGGRNGHIITALGGLPHGRVRRGEPFLVDALGEYRNYFGDFGRTVIVGEPSSELRRRADAMKAGFAAACDVIRPGLKRSALIGHVVSAVQQAGFPDFFYCSPHSIGLEHTDQPIPMGATLHGEATDYALERNMVINIDMPFFEWGWGTMHLEDTIVVGDHGVRALTRLDDALIINGE